MFIQFPHLILKTITFCHLGSMGAAKSCPAYCQRLDFQVDQAAHFSDQIRKSVRLGFQLQFFFDLPYNYNSLQKHQAKHFLQKDGKLFADCVTKTQAAAFLRLKHISKHSKTKSCLESWDVHVHSWTWKVSHVSSQPFKLARGAALGNTCNLSSR